MRKMTVLPFSEWSLMRPIIQANVTKWGVQDDLSTGIASIMRVIVLINSILPNALMGGICQVSMILRLFMLGLVSGT